MTWLKANWERVLIPVIASVISGIVGFFTAILTVQFAIKELDVKITKVATQVEKSIEPELKEIGKQKERIWMLEKDVESLKSQNEIAEQINKMLELGLEQHRKRTYEELQSLLKEIEWKQK